MPTSDHDLEMLASDGYHQARNEIMDLRRKVRDLDGCLLDQKRITRELDVALNGEAGAAKQASLCDILAQVKDQRWKLVRTEA